MNLRKAAAVAAVFSGTAFAFGAAYGQQDEKFKSLDKDSDGFVSKSETSHVRNYEHAFAKGDENRDGKLTPAEFFESEAAYDRIRLGKYIDDTVLTTKVKTALFREKDLKSMDVSVQTNEGRVVLSGFVDSEAQREAALRVARKIDGVRDVKDGLMVKK
ncbi:MAG TPA: BON domain-containing protein [Burkholderiales bacterium]|nr:BON domain-containing protein [Burkholderiales bacterium]